MAIEMPGRTRLKTDISGQHSRFNLMQPLSNLIDLPMEVLFEILLLLEWKDILRIRQTCQLLRDVSLARPVWLSLVRWYSATVRPRPFFPEKPLGLYTDRELERLVLRWQSGRIGSTRPKQRDIMLPKIFAQWPYYLVEGGRWFLFGSDDGSIKYFDLDVPTETSEPVTLIPTFFDNPGIMVSVDMDLGAEYLTFNLGIITYRRSGPRGDLNDLNHARWIQIYRVTPDWDENGQVKGLRAEQLACFPGECLCACDSFTLRGRYVAYSVSSYAPGASIVIVDWTLADPTSLNYPRRLLWRPTVWWLALLPDDRLICQDSSSILLFDLNDAAVTTMPATQPNQPPAQPPVASLRMNLIAISRPYVLPDSIRFSALTDKGIEGIIIPSPGVSHTMNCLDLFSDSKRISSAYLNYDRAILCHPDRTMQQYVWPDEDSSLLMLPKTVVEAPYSKFISFDSSTSRIVTRPKASEISIVDLASV